MGLLRRVQAWFDRVCPLPAEEPRDAFENSAWRSGFQAFEDGREQRACPYSPGRIADLWVMGWRRAQFEAMSL